MRAFTGKYKAPKLQDGQSYYCLGLGCGSCTIKVIEEWSFRQTSGDVVIREEYHTADVSSCCGGEVGIWNDIKDCDVPFELDFVEAP